MKAIVCREFCVPEDLRLEDLPPLQAGPGQVVVSVRAAGVNFPDGLMIAGKYQVKPPFPFTPGSEVAGVVRTVGEGVTRLAPGARVLAYCGTGGYAQEAVVDAASAFTIPDAMDFAAAAGFGLVYGTSHLALRDRADLKAGETLLVLGAAGGVGLAAVQIGKAIGARVIACASSPEKLALCRANGADETIDYVKEDIRARVKELTAGKGLDVVYDPVGGSLAEPMVRSLAWKGRYLVVGFAAGEIPKIPLNLVLLKSADILGVFWGAQIKADKQRHAESVAELFDWFVAGKLKPHVSATFPLARAAEALQQVMGRKAEGKVVITT